MPELPPRLRVFFDADVVIAGCASPAGAAHAMLQLAELGVVDGVTSPTVVEEVRRNLRRKLPAGLPIFEVLWPQALRLVDEAPTIQLSESLVHPKDAPILAAALACEARWLLTFNVRHFSAGSSIAILPPREALNRIRSSLAAIAGH